MFKSFIIFIFVFTLLLGGGAILGAGASAQAEDAPFKSVTIVKEIVRNEKILVATVEIEILRNGKYKTELWTLVMFFEHEAKQLAKEFGSTMLYSPDRKVLIIFNTGENI